MHTSYCYKITKSVHNCTHYDETFQHQRIIHKYSDINNSILFQIQQLYCATRRAPVFFWKQSTQHSSTILYSRGCTQPEI